MAPKIDPRTRQEIAEQLRDLAQQYSAWRYDPQAPDAGAALIEIFSYMAEQLVDGLNQVPDRNFVAFLNLIGVEPLAPRPARVPLTFTLASGVQSARVPAGTQVAAPDPTNGDDILFETERELSLSPATLKAVFVRDPLTDMYGDYTLQATGEDPASFPVFKGHYPIEHSLLLARDDFLTVPGLATVVFTFESPDALQLDALPIVWSCWDGEDWRILDVNAYLLSPYEWQVVIENMPIPQPVTINGIEARWIGAQLDLPLPSRESGAEPIIWTEPILNLTGPFELFSDVQSQPFLIHLEAASADADEVVFTTRLAEQGVASDDLVLVWEYSDGEQWFEIGRSSAVNPSVGEQAFNFVDNTRAFTHDGTIRFMLPPDWDQEYEGGWLRVRVAQGQYGDLENPLPPVIRRFDAVYEWELHDLPQVEQIRTQIFVEQSELIPTLAFTNLQPLDLGADFYPFGEEPVFNDTFYFAHDDAFSKPNALITLDITLTNPVGSERTEAPFVVQPSANLVLAWEAWDGKSWQQLGLSGIQYASLGVNTYGFSDTTFALTRNGQVSFRLPWQREIAVLANGEAGYWLRARIVQGNYGNATTVQNNTIIPATFRPPSIASMRIAYQYVPQGPLKHCWGYNDFTYVDYSALAEEEETYFQPYVYSQDTSPALYLAFESGLAGDVPPFVNTPVSLYLETDSSLNPEDMDAVAEASAMMERPQIVWEYSSPTGWKALGAGDETHSLTERGLVRFIGPADFARRYDFGRYEYWLRLRLERGAYPVDPRLALILPNTTWASQHVTVENELLGSSNGEPGQRFAVSVVLTGVTIDCLEVREDDVWFKWQRVPDFYASDAQDTHFVLDSATGEIQFGDGLYGRIPPKGMNNIRVTYRAGGGTHGNLPAGVISDLKSTIPGVDSVINRLPSSGGTDREELQRVMERAPRTLRHRDRAVTAQDFVDLALEITAVRRAVAITPADNAEAGRVGLIVVPDSEEPRPIPSLSLINTVRDYIYRRVSPTVSVWITGPDWVEVSIAVEVAPSSFDAATTLRERIITRLDAFLNPLTGGLDGQGWPFGRRPHRSDIYALVESIDGVDHVRYLNIQHSDLSTVRPKRFLVYSGMHTVSLTAPLEERR